MEVKSRKWFWKHHNEPIFEMPNFKKDEDRKGRAEIFLFGTTTHSLSSLVIYFVYKNTQMEVGSAYDIHLFLFLSPIICSDKIEMRTGWRQNTTPQ